MSNIQPYTNVPITKLIGDIDFYDVGLWQNKNIDLKCLLSEKTEKDCIRTHSLDKDLFFSWYLTFLNDTLIAGKSIDESNGMFFIYNTRTKTKKWTKYNPKTKVDKKYRKSLYSGVINANPSKSSILFASRHFDQILFYDFEGNVTKEYYFSELKTPELSLDFNGVSNQSVTYAISTCATSKYCYVFRILQSMQDIITNPEEFAQILVFGWEGTLKNVYKLPVLPECFCVDGKDEFLYLIKSNKEANEPFVKIIKYSIDE
jgi:hypothetical protein